MLRQGGVEPYGAHEWQLVQSHLLLGSGEIQELWRPGPDSGREDAADLIGALDKAIAQLELKPQPPLPGYTNPRLAAVGPGGLVMQVVLRFPPQPNVRGQRNLGVDWISLSAEEAAPLLPPAGIGDDTWDIPEALAAGLLIHFRPPVDIAMDEDEAALAQVTDVQLRARILGEVGGITHVGLAGGLTMARPPWAAPLTEDGGKWIGIKRASFKARGFLAVNEGTGEIVDAAMELTQATLIPPDGREVRYEGVAQRLEAPAPR